MVETITKRKIRVTNRNNGTTGYQLNDGTIRNFAPGQSMILNFDEIELLQHIRGGDYLIRNFFIIEDEDALKDLNIDTEPEYKYTEKEIRYLLGEGTLDQLEDALNFAPEGVIELIKQIAVDEEVPDTRKRTLITEKTGFNIDNAIMVRKVMATEDTPAEENKPTERKAAPVTVEAAPARKSAGVTINK